MNTNNKLFKLEEYFFVILFISFISLFTLSAIKANELGETYKNNQIELNNKLAGNVNNISNN